MSINEGLKNEFINMKYQYDTLNQSMKLARNYTTDDEIIKKIINAKSFAKEGYLESCDKILKKMPVNKNVIELLDGWYAIRFFSSNTEKSIKIEMLQPNDVYLVEKDVRNGRDMTRAELENIVPACVDCTALEIYKHKIYESARHLLYTEYGLDSPVEYCDDENAKPIGISFHAGTRWVQRVHCVHPTNEKLAEEYRRNNQRLIEEEILEGFKSAEHIWTNEDDGVQFFLDPSNIVYVKGRDNAIITLYEEDFGFSKEINRQIVWSQLNVLGDMSNDLDRKEHEVFRGIEGIQRVVSEINDEVQVLEASLEALNARKSLMVSQREDYSKSIMRERAKFTMEYNKLFKKFEG